jgi:hypothetical protein
LASIGTTFLVISFSLLLPPVGLKKKVMVNMSRCSRTVTVVSRVVGCLGNSNWRAARENTKRSKNCNLLFWLQREYILLFALFDAQHTAV